MGDVLELARAVRSAATDFKGPIELVVYVLTFTIILRVLHIDIRKIPRALATEFKELGSRRFTVGGFNAMALILTFILGGLVIASAHFQSAQQIIAGLIGRTKAHELAEDSHTPMFYVFGLIVVCSLWFLFRTEIERQRRLERQAYRRSATQRRSGKS